LNRKGGKIGKRTGCLELFPIFPSFLFKIGFRIDSLPIFPVKPFHP